MRTNFKEKNHTCRLFLRFPLGKEHNGLLIFGQSEEPQMGASMTPKLHHTSSIHHLFEGINGVPGVHRTGRRRSRGGLHLLNGALRRAACERSGLLGRRRRLRTGPRPRVASLSPDRSRIRIKIASLVGPIRIGGIHCGIDHGDQSNRNPKYEWKRISCIFPDALAEDMHRTGVLHPPM